MTIREGCDEKMKKLILNFDAELVNDAITAKIILENQVMINILRANVHEAGGVFLIEVPNELVPAVRELLAKKVA